MTMERAAWRPLMYRRASVRVSCGYRRSERRNAATSAGIVRRDGLVREMGPIVDGSALAICASLVHPDRMPKEAGQADDEANGAVQPPPRDKLLLTLPEGAAELGVGIDTMYRLVASGQLRRLKLGASTHVARADLQALCERLMRDGSIPIPPYREIKSKRRKGRRAAPDLATQVSGTTPTGSPAA